MSSEEFTRWVAFMQREPSGFEVENWRMGVIASTVANTIPRKPGARAFTPQDFMPDVGDGSSRLTEEQREFIQRKKRAHRGKRRHDHR